jgi:NAD(P)-dependent dehydrogenase (short-subunit alcohol dehydrogenase family)
LLGRLDGKVAIITGSARGIGRAVALGFAREAARVVVADMRGELAQDTVAEITAAGGQALACAVDVSEGADLDRLVAATLERFGQIDILHNNAGISGLHGDLLAYTPEEWDRILNINVRSAFFLAQRVIRVMIDRGRGGAILNTASTSAFISSSRPIVPYDVSKAAMRQLTVSLAAHVVDYGIRVNAIAPGTIDTELGAGSQPPEVRRAQQQKRAEEKIPMKRLGQPADLVGAAIYLCSDEAAYVTGHTLVVDGGVLLL